VLRDQGDSRVPAHTKQRSPSLALTCSMLLALPLAIAISRTGLCQPAAIRACGDTRAAIRACGELPELPERGPAITTDRAEVESVRRVWALIFNPRSDNEGIYSRSSGSSELVLCFEDEEGAERYATLLAAQDFPEATRVAMDTSTLLEFCDEGGFSLGLVRSGQVVLPPEANVGTFAWSPGASEEGAALGEEDPSVDESRRALERLFSQSSDDGQSEVGPAE